MEASLNQYVESMSRRAMQRAAATQSIIAHIREAGVFDYDPPLEYGFDKDGNYDVHPLPEATHV